MSTGNSLKKTEITHDAVFFLTIMFIILFNKKKKEIYVAQGFFTDLGYILAAKCKSVFSFSLSRQVFEIQRYEL